MNLAVIEWGGLVLLMGGLTWLSIIDWRTCRLPNVLTKPLILLGLVYSLNISLDVYPYLLGAVLGYLIFLSIETAYRLIRKREGLGRGDAKLLAAGGAWCGAMALPFIILIASGAALAYVLTQEKSERATLKLPFGPFLAIAIALVFIGLKFI